MKLDSQKLVNLREKERKLLNQLSIIRENIEHWENIEITPILKKQYEGKFFKEEESDGENSYVKYIRVCKVFGINRVQTWGFIKRHHGSFQIQEDLTSFRGGLHSGYQEISFEEFNSAYLQLISSINSYYDFHLNPKSDDIL